MTPQKFFRWTLLLAILPFALAAGCLRNPVTNRREAKMISEPTERSIGAETRRKLIEEYGEVKDPVVREYVSGVGKKLAALSDRPRLDFEFTILETDLVNAFAAPGGYVFITRGILEEMSNEAELAVVLGHEIGHVCAWHSIKMIEKQMGYGTLATLGAIVSGIQLGPEAMILVAQTADLFTNLYLSGYSREYELEADRVGIRYAISAGYDPQSALSFFNKLQALEKQEGLDKWKSFFASHPPTADRIEQLKRYNAHMNFTGRTFQQGGAAYLEVRDRLPHLSVEEAGVATGLRFSQERWGISFEIPSGWRWDAKNRQALAAFREEKGEGWGYLLRRPALAGMRAEDLAGKICAEKHWMSLQGHEVLYPAGYGFLGRYMGEGILGGVYQFRVLFLVRENAGYALVCGAAPDRIDNYLIPFEQILRSFRLN